MTRLRRNTTVRSELSESPERTVVLVPAAWSGARLGMEARRGPEGHVPQADARHCGLAIKAGRG